MLDRHLSLQRHESDVSVVHGSGQRQAVLAPVLACYTLW